MALVGGDRGEGGGVEALAYYCQLQWNFVVEGSRFCCNYSQPDSAVRTSDHAVHKHDQPLQGGRELYGIGNGR